MLVLAIETATDLCSLALLEEGRLAAEIRFRHRMSLSQRLAPHIEFLLHDAGWALQDVGLLAVSLGPGSFTGLRIGVVMAKTLAWTLEKPVVGVSTLEAVAAPACRESAFPALICPALHARRGEVYAACYRQGSAGAGDIPVLSPLHPPAALEDEAFLNLLRQTDAPILCLGDGALRLESAIREAVGDRAGFAPEPFHSPRAEWVGLLADAAYRQGRRDDPLRLTPAYLKKSIVEIKKKSDRPAGAL
ncbi:MAG: tRNA (adenosine(37)-N6)-threonylcarbamoyltransferase complex dimerization subunit type 1 TsaB [Armatimonadetes bacterium]|nr:tRNA (adenosine(37)-N6)-threonylcarbamoyltransferase complex dimerization subunit type 1 TsaB [Armatimonadota bacterium]